MANAASGAGSIPITIITGLLGAGKTTLVNNIVAHNRNQVPCSTLGLGVGPGAGGLSNSERWSLRVLVQEQNVP